LCALAHGSCRVPIDGTAFTASSLVILPSLQFLLRLLEQYFFCLIFFLLLEMVFLKRKLLPAAAGAGTVVSAFELLLLGAVSAAAGAEPDGLAAAVSRQTTALLLLHLFFSFNVLFHLLQQVIQELLYQNQPLQSLGLFYVISVFY
jgi:hypothetical protein